MSASREKLEAAVAEVEQFCDTLDAKGANATTADAAKLRGLMDQVTEQQRRYKVSDAKAFLKQLGGDGSGRAGSGSENPADLMFSKDQLVELQKGAVDRRITSKAAVSSTTASMAGIAQYNLNVFPFLRSKQRILDLIPQQRTEAPAVHYFSGTTAASGATAVAEGAAKPESTPAWTEVTATVRKLAHYTRVNDEVLADFDTFRQVIGTEMLAGLIDRENAQLVTGTGIAPNILGLAAEPNVLTVGSAGTDLDAIAAAFAALRVGASHCDPDVVVMHPNDWYSSGFLLAKETGGAYLLGDPVSAVKPMLWGIPVVLTESMTENTALVANLQLAATAYIRQPPTVEVAPAGGGTTEFIANQTLIRAETRLALAIHHPTAICLVTAV